MNWTIIKCLAAHVFGDYGLQSTRMAQHKGSDAIVRSEHALSVGAAFAVALATDNQLSWLQKSLVIAANMSTHFVIDSFKMPKALDQALHGLIAVVSVLVMSHE